MATLESRAAPLDLGLGCVDVTAIIRFVVLGLGHCRAEDGIT